MPGTRPLDEAEALRLAAAAARPDQPGALLAGIEAAAAATIAPDLLTVMLLIEARMEVERLHSSNPGAYPAGGRKAKRSTDWGRQVLTERRPFTGEGEAAIRAAFDDHAIILGLGLRSVVNMPVVFAGRCLGTVNLLFRSPRLPAGATQAAALLALVAIPALQAALAQRGIASIDGEPPAPGSP